MRAVLWLTMGIDRREWVAVHRKHHVFSDQPQDPHSPVQRGVWQVTFLNVVYYRREAKRNDTIQTFGRDLAPDRIERRAVLPRPARRGHRVRRPRSAVRLGHRR